LAESIQIEHVLVNLLRNGIEAMRDAGMRGVITVKTRAEDSGVVRVSVRDSGPGLDSETVKHLFDPFYTTKAQGLGMGLAISRTIIESLGGRIWAEPGKGATFHFTLPLAP